MSSLRGYLEDPRDPNETDDLLKMTNKYGALRKACENGNLTAVKFFLDNIALDRHDSCYIEWAAKNGHLEVLKLLCEDPRLDPTINGTNEPLYEAFINGWPEVVDYLFENKRVNPQSSNSVDIKTIYNMTLVVKLVLPTMGHTIFMSIDNIKRREFLYFTIPTDEMRKEANEAYDKWLYRVGGEKWSQAVANMNNQQDPVVPTGLIGPSTVIVNGIGWNIPFWSGGGQIVNVSDSESTVSFH